MADNKFNLQLLRNETLAKTKEAAKTAIESHLNLEGRPVICAFKTDDQTEEGILMGVKHLGITEFFGKTEYQGENAIKVDKQDITLLIPTTEKGLSQDADGLHSKLKMKKLTETELIALSEDNVKEAYKLCGSDDVAIGDLVKIYKDKSLKSVELVEEKPGATDDAPKITGQFLKFVYNIEDGSEETVYVDVSKLLAENEFKNGLDVSAAGAVSVKLSTGAESVKYLKFVGDEDGKKSVEVSGIDDAIETAINDLDVTDAAVADQYVSQVSETDGKITVTRVLLPVKQVIAYNGEDADSTTNHLEVETDNSVVSIKLKDVASAEELDRVETAVGLSATGTYVASSDANYVSEATSVKDAIEKLDTQVKQNADDIEASELRAENKSVVITTVPKAVDEHAYKKIRVNIAPSTETIENGVTNFLKLDEAKGLFVSNVLDCGTY